MAVRVCCADRTVTTSFSFSFALLAHPGRRLSGARGVYEYVCLPAQPNR